MTRVDFYVLPNEAPDAELQLVCRLTDKAWQQGHLVYIHAEDGEQAARLDQLLWTFRQNSFIPHEIAGGEAQVPVRLGHGAGTDAHGDILINLQQSVPAFHAGFDRIIEIIPRDATRRNAGRQRYQVYKQAGYELNTVDL